MLKDETFSMFDLGLMKYFYDPAYEKDESVINAWYIYVLKVLPTVSKGWKDATAPDKLTVETSIFKCITISDEAIMRWFLEIWIPKLTKSNKLASEKANEKSDYTIKTSGERVPNDTKSNTLESEKDDEKSDNSFKTPRKRGPHDTNVKLDMYTTLFHEIANARKKYSTAVRWNQIFWNEVRKRNETMLEENKTAYQRSKSFKNVSQLCLPDLNENQEFLATYNLDAHDDFNYNEDNSTTSIVQDELNIKEI